MITDFTYVFQQELPGTPRNTGPCTTKLSTMSLTRLLPDLVQTKFVVQSFQCFASFSAMILGLEPLGNTWGALCALTVRCLPL